MDKLPEMETRDQQYITLFSFFILKHEMYKSFVILKPTNFQNNTFVIIKEKLFL